MGFFDSFRSRKPESFKNESEELLPDPDCVYGRFPTSSILPFLEAREVCKHFGELIAEQSDPKRIRQIVANENLSFTWPVECLGYSKQQVQTALAVTIAQLVVQMAIAPNNQGFQLSDAAAMSSGQLAHFTRQPARFEHNDIEMNSTWVFFQWRETCQVCLKEIEDTHLETAAEISQDTTRIIDAMTEYWRKIDGRIPDLLNEPTLTAIRAT